MGEKDEEQILGEQDQTQKKNLLSLDENMGAKSASLDSLEEGPADFMTGEIDVKKQMDLAERALKRSVAGENESRGEGDRDSELEESFRATPGGLEEVMEKTDEDLAHRP